MNIKVITPYQILDSRGEPTIMVRMVSDSGVSAEFAVPSGASKGKNEAVEKRDNGTDFGGLSVLGNLETISTVLAPKFIGYPLGQQDDFDGLLVALDGSSKKENLGANTLLALSGAYLKLSAVEEAKPLWQYIAETNETSPTFPRLFANIIGGGKHAPGLDIQEYMIVPQTNTPSDAIKTIYDVYHTIQNVMQNLYGPSAKLVGDEGGLAPIGTNTEVILEAFTQLNSKMESKFDIALDAAANTFYKDGIYTVETQQLHASDLLKLYEGWDAKFPIFSIEDPFAETDVEGIEILKTLPKQEKPFLIVADDYTVTNKDKINEFAKDELFDAVIIKPNQVGTITETFDAIKAARAAKSKIIVSHRSGETNDDFIVDLAYGVGAMGIKLGAPVRGERVGKYNRLLEIQADLESTQAASVSSNKPAGPQSTEKTIVSNPTLPPPPPPPFAAAKPAPPSAPPVPQAPVTPPLPVAPPSPTATSPLSQAPIPTSTPPTPPSSPAPSQPPTGGPQLSA
jgi:enolase